MRKKISSKRINRNWRTKNSSRVYIPDTKSKRVFIVNSKHYEEIVFIEQAEKKEFQESKRPPAIKDNTAMSGGCFYFQESFIPNFIYNSFSLIIQIKKGMLSKNKS